MHHCHQHHNRDAHHARRAETEPSDRTGMCAARSSMSSEQAEVLQGSASSLPSPKALVSVTLVILLLLKRCIQDSQERHGRSLATLRRAYASLKVCPVAFRHVEDLEQLCGFESIALRNELQRLLSEWCTKHGRRLLVLSDSALPHSVVASDAVDGHLVDGVARPVRTSNSDDRGKTNKNGKSKPNSQHRDIQKAKKTVTPKAYVPQSRTGTYGILVALFSMTPMPPSLAGTEGLPALDSCATPEHVLYHTKSAIIAHAQPYCDAKYVPKQPPRHFSGGPASFHSAWSGMKTLINRGYVYRRGNPARFGISLLGWKVAETCAHKEDVTAGCRIHSEEVCEQTTSMDVDEIGLIAEQPKGRRKGKRREEKATAADSDKLRPAPFAYAFLTDGTPAMAVTNRAQAHMRLSDADYCLRFRIVFSASQLEHSFAINCVEAVEPCLLNPASLVSGWVKESACNFEAPGIPAEAAGTQGRLAHLPAPEEATSALRPAKGGKANRRKDDENKQAVSTVLKRHKTRPSRRQKRRQGMSSDFLDTSSSDTNGDDGDDAALQTKRLRRTDASAPFARVDNVIRQPPRASVQSKEDIQAKSTLVSNTIDLLASSSDIESHNQRCAVNNSVCASFRPTTAKLGAQQDPVWISSDVESTPDDDDMVVNASPLRSVVRVRRGDRASRI